MSNKCLLPAVVAVALSLGVSAPAQKPAGDEKTAAKSSTEEKQETKTVTEKGTKKSTADTIYGKVESYEAGKSIKVTAPGDLTHSKTFDLAGSDITAHVPATIKVGDWVRVRERTDSKGHKTVTVTASTEKHSEKHSETENK